MSNKFDRRYFLKAAILAGVVPLESFLAHPASPADAGLITEPVTEPIIEPIIEPPVETHALGKGITVNDVHSGLNETHMSAVRNIDSLESIQKAIKEAATTKKGLSICGARHAAGGQQFLTDGILLDTTSYNKVLKLDQATGLVTVQSGIRWLALQNELGELQAKNKTPWGINQKQTGLNSLTVGGTLGANAHGQGLLLQPFVGDIDSFRIITATGDILNCSRTQNAELFGLAIGGYGLFGLVLDVTIRLVPREKLKRKVHRVNISEIEQSFDYAVKLGYRYGHCQLSVDDKSPDFLTRGVFATYEPVPLDSVIDARDINPEAWQQIVNLVHTNKSMAYALYAKDVESSNGHIDWSDSWQNNFYLNGYHEIVDKNLHSKDAASEVLTEFYVPLSDLPKFLKLAKDYFLKGGQNVIFSSIRFIEKDDVTLIPWARKRYACVVLNFHTDHTEQGIKSTMTAWSHLIDLAINFDGNFYLTYQHVANKSQLISCYPNFEKFLQEKIKYDPREIFQSDWYLFHKKMFS